MVRIRMAPTGKHFDIAGLSSTKRYELMNLCGGRKIAEGFRVRLDPSLIAIFAEKFGKHGAQYDKEAIAWIRGELRAPESLCNEVNTGGVVKHRRWNDLRGYQQAGVRWLLKRDRVMLCDQMGLGKTIQMVVAIELSGKARRVLIVCPNYAKEQWRNEVSLWCKDRSARVFVVPSSREAIGGVTRNGVWKEFMASADAQHRWRHYLVVHWSALRLMKEQIAGTWWDWVVIDEAHHMKNHRALRTKALHKVWGARVALLTGTPIINTPDELWSLLHMLWPDKYRSYSRFYNAFVLFWRNKSKRYNRVLGTKNESILKRLVAGFTLRRLRNEVLTDLPPVIREVYRVPMTSQQKGLYKRLKRDVLVKIGEEGGGVLILNALARTVRLLQAASSIAHFGLKGGGDSGKFDAVRDYTLNRLEEGEKVVVFCKFVLSVELIAARLRKKGIKEVGVFHGKSGDEAFTKFRAGDESIRVLVCTFGVAKEAVNLQNAGIVVLAELPWSYAELEQAVARADRIGQKRVGGVVCAVFMSRRTIDEHVWRIVNQKRKIAKSILVLTEALSAEVGSKPAN